MTKSLTQGKPPRRAPDDYTGKPSMEEEHPLITCAPHVMGGHAHLKANKTTIERVLLAELQQIRGPIQLSSGLVLTEQERRACLLYAVDIFENLSKLYAQLRQLQEIGKRTGKHA